VISHIVFPILAVSVTIFICVHIVPALWHALLTGEWLLREPNFTRSERPILFWAGFFAWSGVVVLAIFGSYALIVA
jgi:hypothetical protein